VAAQGFSRHTANWLDARRTTMALTRPTRFLADPARDYQRLAGNPGRFSRSQKNGSR
jgi:hypothetical protein